jgi:hypothetical protein
MSNTNTANQANTTTKPQENAQQTQQNQPNQKAPEHSQDQKTPGNTAATPHTTQQK